MNFHRIDVNLSFYKNIWFRFSTEIISKRFNFIKTMAFPDRVRNGPVFYLFRKSGFGTSLEHGQNIS